MSKAVFVKEVREAAFTQVVMLELRHTESMKSFKNIKLGTPGWLRE